MKPFHRRLAVGLSAAFVATAASAQTLPMGVCTFDEVALRLPAEDFHDWQSGHHKPTTTKGFTFAIAVFSDTAGGVRMDEPMAEGAKRYVGVSKQVDLRFVWDDNVFVLPADDRLATASGRRVLYVRYADKPVIDVLLGSCSQDGFKGGEFATEFFEAVNKQ